MRRFVFLALVFVFVMAVASVAVANPDTWNADNSAAGGQDGSTYNVVDPATQTPHGSYATTGDECEICHSPHNAGDGVTSYKLLRATDVGSACDYCHAAGGAAQDPYLVYLDDVGVDLDKTDLNGHEIGGFGAAGVPDDTNGAPTTLLGGVLGCFDCHSVHGADTLGAVAFGTSANGLTVGAGNDLPSYAILKADPGNTLPGSAANINEYCDSCHTNNYVTTVNGVSHYMGTADAAGSTGGAGDVLSAYASTNCESCHRDNTDADEFIWPHNSSSEALMDWTTDGLAYDGTNAVTRGSMDGACMSCHDDVGTAGGY